MDTSIHGRGPTIYLTRGEQATALIKNELGPIVQPFEVLAFLTWEFVMEALAGALISWIGSRVLDNLFSGGNGQSITPQQFLELVQKTMRQALAEHDIMLLTRHYEALVEDMQEFNAGGGQHRLDHADLEVNELIIGFKSYGDITADLLASAELLKIAILQTYTNEGIRNERTNIEQRARAFKNDLSAAAATRLRLIEGYFWGPTIKTFGRGEMVEFGYMYKGEFAPVVSCWPNDFACTSTAHDRAEASLARGKNLEIKHRHQPFLNAIHVLEQLLAPPRAQEPH